MREFLINNGIKQPKVLLMVRGTADSGEASQDLVFNITPVDFASEDLYKSVMQHLSWFLPRHYSFLGMEEKQAGNGFMPL